MPGSKSHGKVSRQLKMGVKKEGFRRNDTAESPYFCTWGQRKRFADGKVSFAYTRFLGYDQGEDGSIVINEEQAATVCRIYGMFL